MSRNNLNKKYIIHTYIMIIYDVFIDVTIYIIIFSKYSTSFKIKATKS